ncbi:hypothetical protein H257_18562 [Aphanomyces astaci]|uniref:Uncharacterized protein n=1 Tax=Aphanomyces astaci TaxID=112090 RepID=W4FCZ0_APHAT|nr:hypothetical protein H257_18562 [Aphanomyces astaci]ETV64558.1 hypothetical protein H257_18562 [Aphanomyces astaci]|eukprot:XP_009845955.1 hypothetical protein H257_18562 [Aphanomyces astaci]
MSTNSDFTIEGARRSRISDSSRPGYLEARAPDAKHRGWGPMTLDLRVFAYENFLELIVWTDRERDVGLGALNGYRSAVKSLYIDQGVALPEPYDGDMKNLQNGSKEFTGKRPMSLSMLEHLRAASMGLPDCGFTHLYLVITWNLMCRSKSTETIRFEHMSCEGDAIGLVHPHDLLTGQFILPLLSTPLFASNDLVSTLRPLVFSGTESTFLFASGIPPTWSYYGNWIEMKSRSKVCLLSY